MYDSIETLGETNRILREETGALQERLYRARHALQQIVKERAAIVRRQKKLNRRATKLEKQIQCYSLALAPHKRLPQEILCRIFELCCSDITCFPSSRIEQYAPQRILSRVCSSWRQLVLHTPQLWHNVRVEFNYHTPVREVASAAHAWLSLGKAIPGCLVIIDNGESLEDPTDVILDLIVTYKPKKLCLRVFDRQLRKIMKLPKDAGLSCIQEIHIVDLQPSVTSAEHSDAVAPLSYNDKLTNLTAVQMWTEVPDLQSIPWHQLQHIEITAPLSSSFCLSILQQSSDVLETCYLHISSEDFIGETSSMQTIHCVNLRRLELTYYTQDQFLTKLRMPKLKSLYIDGIYSGLSTILFKIQEQSGMSLDDLVLRSSREELDVGSLLRSMPSLRRINLPEAIILDDKTIEELSSGSIGRRLEEITVWKYFATPDVDKVLQMVKARAKSGAMSRSGPSSFKVVKLCLDHKAAGAAEMIRKIRMLGVRIDTGIFFMDCVPDRLSTDESSDSGSSDS